MTSHAQEWQVDYEKARGTLNSLRGAGDERQVRFSGVINFMFYMAHGPCPPLYTSQ